MIIVSQDKEIIVNFDNVESIGIVVDVDGTGKIPHKIYQVQNEKNMQLATYKTKERAKEVLREIIDKYKNSCEITYNNLSTPTLVPRPIVYEMPEK